MVIGKLVQGRSHLDYVAQIYGPGESEVTPQPEAYALGSFVRVTLPSPPGGWLVGLICDTALLNPEFGRLGPRLSNPADLAVFSPDYLHKKAVLVGLTIIGRVYSNEQARQTVPSLAALSDSPVERLTTDQIQAFHGEPGAFRMAYVPRLITALEISRALDVLALALDQLRPLFPQAGLRQFFDLMVDDLRWRRQITPFGSGQ